MSKYTDKSYRPSIYSDMTIGDILRAYREAKHKFEQIEIISDFTLLPPKTIKEILRKNGYDIVTKQTTYERKIRYKTYARWTADEEQKLKELMKSCRTWDEISAEFSSHTCAGLKSRASRMGLKIQNPKRKHVYTKPKVLWSDQQKEIALALAADGASVFEIAARIGRDPCSVRGWFAYQRSKGESVPALVDARRLTKNKKEK